LLHPALRILPAGALLIAAACTAKPKDAVTTKSADSSMAGHDMAGMNMAGMESHPITIPKGVMYTKADVEFMQGMIPHHAQAIFMSRLAKSHGASEYLQKFTQKIDQSQTAEIRIMQDWLTAKYQFAPDTASYHHVHMAGMLTDEQIKQLDAARGKEFERLFLVFMIQHHEGALQMVTDLFAAPGAGQESDIGIFANDVRYVQTTEIQLMRQMLANL